MFNILVVEDDANTRKLMESMLVRDGYQVYLAENGQVGLAMMDRQMIDLVVLDIMMPQMDGYEFTTQLRSSGSTIPILMVSAKHLPAERRKGFLVGTDDYMTKPVDLEEMRLRIRALLRRSQIANSRKLTVGHFVLDYDSLTVTWNGEKRELPQKEFQLLFLLLSYPDRIFTRLQLMDEIWGVSSESGDATVNVHMNRLRQRFKDNGDFELVTVRGVGYKAVLK